MDTIRSYRLNYIGIIFGFIGFFLALTPSLVPRPAEFVGLVGGLGFALFYAFGCIVSATLRRFLKPSEPNLAAKRRAWRILFVGAPVYIVAMCCLSGYWQNNQLRLLDQEPIEGLGVATIVVISVAVFLLLHLLSRLIVKLYRFTYKHIQKIPLPLPYIGGLLAAIVMVVVIFEVSTGVLRVTAVESIRGIHSYRNSRIEPGYDKPTSPLRSGSDMSESAWELLGIHGRRFVAEGPSDEDISSFVGGSAKEPIRVYAGLESADSQRERIDIVLDELERTGAFERDVLMVTTPTGTGWLESETLAAFEYMHGGDTAIASMQYSYLPSAYSFILDRGEATSAGASLFSAIERKINSIPDDKHKPKLVVYGLSLGSFGAQAAFSDEQDMANRVSGALFVGTPGFSEPWRTITRNRDAGSPQIKPVYNQERVIKFATQSNEIPYEEEAQYKVVYYQYATDPFVWWDGSLLYRKPDWLREDPGRAVMPTLRWTPLLTFVQVSIDQIFSLTLNGDNGHDYSHDTAAAMAAATKPEGWSQELTEKLQEHINSEE